MHNKKHRKPSSFLITTRSVVDMLETIYHLQRINPPRAHFSDALYNFSPSTKIFATTDIYKKVVRAIPHNLVVETLTPENIRLSDTILVVGEIQQNGKMIVTEKHIRQERHAVLSRHHQGVYSGHGRPSMFSF